MPQKHPPARIAFSTASLIAPPLSSRRKRSGLTVPRRISERPGISRRGRGLRGTTRRNQTRARRSRHALGAPERSSSMDTALWRRGALVALVAASAAATLALRADPAFAAYTAHVQAGTLEITGNAASDKLALRLEAGSPSTLELDVGEDGTADFSFDRTTFTAIVVNAGG